MTDTPTLDVALTERGWRRERASLILPLSRGGYERIRAELAALPGAEENTYSLSPRASGVVNHATVGGDHVSVTWDNVRGRRLMVDHTMTFDVDHGGMSPEGLTKVDSEWVVIPNTYGPHARALAALNTHEGEAR
jgi:hypothetical protein